MGKYVYDIKNFSDGVYVVTVPYVNDKVSDERVKWVEDNVNGKYSDRLTFDKNRKYKCAEYHFSNKNDALIFKMVWG